MDELPPRAKEVLRRAQGLDDCRDPDARRRVREGVNKAVAGSVLGMPPRGTKHLSAPLRARLSALTGKLAVSTFVVVLVGTGIAVRQATHPAPASSRVDV